METAFRPDWRVHPGETLKELLSDNHLTQKVAAVSLGVSESYLSDILNGRRGVSSEFAGRLGGVFGPTSGFWLRLQALYDEPKEALEGKGAESSAPSARLTDNDR